MTTSTTTALKTDALNALDMQQIELLDRLGAILECDLVAPSTAREAKRITRRLADQTGERESIIVEWALAL